MIKWLDHDVFTSSVVVLYVIKTCTVVGSSSADWKMIREKLRKWWKHSDSLEGRNLNWIIHSPKIHEKNSSIKWHFQSKNYFRFWHTRLLSLLHLILPSSSFILCVWLLNFSAISTVFTSTCANLRATSDTLGCLDSVSLFLNENIPGSIEVLAFMSIRRRVRHNNFSLISRAPVVSMSASLMPFNESEVGESLTLTYFLN